MSLISELEFERNRYYKLRDDVKSICTNLNTSADHLDEASIQLDKYYLIDDEAVDNKKFKTIITDINSVYDVLNETILPAINTKIEQLSNEITRLQEQVAM